MNNNRDQSDKKTIQRAIEIYQKEGIRSLASSARDFVHYDIFKPIKTYIMGIGDQYQLIGPDEIYSDSFYEKRRQDPWRSEANHVGNVLYRMFEPQSVIDFGCAVGSHLEPFYKRGVEVQGVEAHEAAIENAVIPQEHILQHDLREPFEVSKKYDLAISIEVAEHIPERFSDTFVSTISKSSNTIVLTAAQPGQGGDHHVNEQPKSYWVQKFEKRGFIHDEEQAKTLAQLLEVEHSDWVKDNLLLFKR